MINGYSKDIFHFDDRDFATLCICALRYCHGRQTYMPSTIQEIVINNLDMISDNDINIILEDCEWQERMQLFGDERIDKPGWIRFYTRLREEKERRSGKQ